MSKFKVKLPAKVTRTIYGAGHQIKKHSPEILVAAGVVGTVTSAVLACKATLKVHDVICDAKDDIEDIHVAVEKGLTPAGNEYTAEDGQKDLTITYVQTGVKLIKLYAPAVALGALSITGIVASNNILRKRNIALAAAYTAVDKGFKEYRGRVIERFGKDLDRELRYNIKAKEVEETVINEDGTEQVVKTTVNVVDPNSRGDFVKCFDETCPNWTRDAEYNFAYLKQVQSFFNERLRIEKIVFLNDVYKELGFLPTKTGQIVGWVYDEVHPVGDNFIDFGIFDLNDEQKRNFVNGYEKSIWLEFNCDGVVYDLLQ